MGIRFKKSVKIFKGVKINFSKSGASLSVGGKGHSLNFSSRGVKSTTGIPGTGLSYSNMLSENSFKSNMNRSTSKTNTLHNTKSITEILIKMDENGKVVILGSDGMPIIDEAFIRRIKATPAYQAEKQRLELQRQQILTQMYNESVSEKEKLINIHRMSPIVVGQEEFFKSLQALEPQKYVIPKFTTTVPDINNTKARLEKEAKENVHGNIFKISSLRKKYVEENLQTRYSKELADWEKEREAYIQYHQKIANEENKRYQEIYEEQCQHITGLINGDSEIVVDAINEWLISCEFPMKVNIDYELYLDNNLIFLDIDLPLIEELPETELIRLESGNLREKKKTQLSIKNEYKTLVLSLAVFIASQIFNISPSIHYLAVSGYTQCRDKDGQFNDEYIYSILFSRNQFENRNLEKIDPVEFCMRFENRINLTSTMNLKRIKPYEYDEILKLL